MSVPARAERRPRATSRRALPARLAAALLAVLALAPATAAAAGPVGKAPPGTRPVLAVGNNWDGTADILDVPSYERLKRINVVPDYEERMAEAMLEHDGFARLLVIRALIGEGHDQLVDDLYTSNDGRTLYVSRPSFADVVAIDIATNQIVWRTPVFPGLDHHGERADHMAMSPDGTHLAVSAQRLIGPAPHRVVIIEAATGRVVNTFPSGDVPHENVYSRDGSRIFHASIGRVFLPDDHPMIEAPPGHNFSSKGDRVFQIVDSKSMAILKKFNMGKKLEEAGYPGMSAAVRPMTLSPDEKWLYFQVSFFHGFVEFDLERERVTRIAELPTSEATPQRREDYILDSAHHGIAMNGAGTKLCVAGTMSNYAAIVDRADFSHRIHPLGARTYWSTTSADGKYCYVSVAGDDTMSIISYKTEQEVARVPVGYHPQRARTGNVSVDIFGAPPSPNRARPKALSLRVSPARDRRAPYRFRLRGRLRMPAGVKAATGCRGVVRVDLRRGGAVVASARAKLRRAGVRCRYARTLRVPAAKVRGERPVRLTAHARFVGNDALAPRPARARAARIR